MVLNCLYLEMDEDGNWTRTVVMQQLLEAEPAQTCFSRPTTAITLNHMTTKRKKGYFQKPVWRTCLQAVLLHAIKASLEKGIYRSVLF